MISLTNLLHGRHQTGRPAGSSANRAGMRIDSRPSVAWQPSSRTLSTAANAAAAASAKAAGKKSLSLSAVTAVAVFTVGGAVMFMLINTTNAIDKNFTDANKRREQYYYGSSRRH